MTQTDSQHAHPRKARQHHHKGIQTTATKTSKGKCQPACGRCNLYLGIHVWDSSDVNACSCGNPFLGSFPKWNKMCEHRNTVHWESCQLYLWASRTGNSLKLYSRASASTKHGAYMGQSNSTTQKHEQQKPAAVWKDLKRKPYVRSVDVRLHFNRTLGRQTEFTRTESSFHSFLGPRVGCAGWDWC